MFFRGKPVADPDSFQKYIGMSGIDFDLRAGSANVERSERTSA